ncbi:hypothetical protein [Stappia sp.]
MTAGNQQPVATGIYADERISIKALGEPALRHGGTAEPPENGGQQGKA